MGSPQGSPLIFCVEIALGDLLPAAGGDRQGEHPVLFRRLPLLVQHRAPLAYGLSEPVLQQGTQIFLRSRPVQSALGRLILTALPHRQGKGQHQVPGQGQIPTVFYFIII